MVARVLEFRPVSATADPALVKERSIALRRRVSSKPTLIDTPWLADRPSIADHPLSGFCTYTAVVLVIFALTYV